MRKVKIFKWMAFLLTGTVFLSSCSTDDFTGGEPDIPAAGNEIKFEIGFAGQAPVDGLQTRASTGADFTSVWEDGDAIGVFAVTGNNALSGTVANNYINNVKLTYNNGTWTPETPVYYAGGEELGFYAYFPYDASRSNPLAVAFTIATDQSAETDFNKSHFMLAEVVSGITSGYPVNLQFSHKLAMVQVVIDNQTEVAINNGFKVTQTNVSPGIIANLQTGAVTPSGTAQDIIFYPFASNTYRALVPAGSATAGSKLLFEQAAPNWIYNIYDTAITTTAGEVVQLQIELKK